VKRSTAKKTIHGYFGVTKSMLKKAVVKRRGNAMYYGDIGVSWWDGTREK
jgi:hypothetical protein